MDPTAVEFTFGKYQGLSVADVAAANPGYITWCTDNNGIRDRYPDIIEAIDALNGGTDSTPVHNQIQAAFLDNGFTYGALEPILTTITNRVIPHSKRDAVERLYQEFGKYSFKDGEFLFIRSGGGSVREVYSGDVSIRKFNRIYSSNYDDLLFVVGTDLHDFESDGWADVTSFENFCDVCISYTERDSFTVDFRVVPTEYVSLFSASPEERPHAIDLQEHTKCVRHLYHTTGTRSIGIEIKPTIGDEYPKVMRQMAGQAALAAPKTKRGTPTGMKAWDVHVLYTRDNVSNLSDDVLKKMFEKNNITLIIDRDTPLP